MSALLARALSVSAVGWQKMLTEGCSLEKALTFCLINQDQDLKEAVHILLYSAVRQRAKTSLLLEKLVHKEPTPTNKAILSIALALLLEQKEKTFTVVNQAVEAVKSDPSNAWAAGFVNAVLRNFLLSLQY